jgi:hypothetical protein
MPAYLMGTRTEAVVSRPYFNMGVWVHPVNRREMARPSLNTNSEYPEGEKIKMSGPFMNSKHRSNDCSIFISGRLQATSTIQHENFVWKPRFFFYVPIIADLRIYLHK